MILSEKSATFRDHALGQSRACCLDSARAPQIDRLVQAQSADQVLFDQVLFDQVLFDQVLFDQVLFDPCAVRRTSALLYAGGARLKVVGGAIAHLTLLAGR
jgi:hypothetical protein